MIRDNGQSASSVSPWAQYVQQPDDPAFVRRQAPQQEQPRPGGDPPPWPQPRPRWGAFAVGMLTSLAAFPMLAGGALACIYGMAELVPDPGLALTGLVVALGGAAVWGFGRIITR